MEASCGERRSGLGGPTGGKADLLVERERGLADLAPVRVLLLGPDAVGAQWRGSGPHTVTRRWPAGWAACSLSQSSPRHQ